MAWHEHKPLAINQGGRRTKHPKSGHLPVAFVFLVFPPFLSPVGGTAVTTVNKGIIIIIMY